MSGDRFFHRAYYLKQLGARAPGSLAQHFREEGQHQNLDPNPWFCTEWYKWQNPDWVDFESPVQHYLERGRHETRDPSPLVDMTAISQWLGPATDPASIMDRLMDGLKPPTGLYDSWKDLERAQCDFLQPISATHIKLHPPGHARRNLVFIQSGPANQALQCLQPDHRDFDLLLNFYDSSAVRPNFAEYAFCQPGTKFTAMATLWKRFAALFLQYDFVMLLDDDILISNDVIDQAFRQAEEHRLDLAQVALSERSHCIWEIFRTRGDAEIRFTNGVEIMMPILSRKAMAQAGPLFRSSISGFGLDFLWGRHLAGDRLNMGVLNKLTAHHDKPVNDREGAYYASLRSRNINPKAELWRLITQHGLERAFREMPQE